VLGFNAAFEEFESHKPYNFKYGQLNEDKTLRRRLYSLINYNLKSNLEASKFLNKSESYILFRLNKALS